MTEITIWDLRRERGNWCEFCGVNEAEQRHHCLVKDIKRWHGILTVKENIMQVCGDCHTGDCKVNGYDVRLKFWTMQCERYGVGHMLDWLNSLPIKLFYSRRIDFVDMREVSVNRRVLPQKGLVMSKNIVCDNYCYRNHTENVGIYDRLASSPSAFTDAELAQLTSLGNGRVLKGRNAKIPPMAFLELDRRHSPTGKAK